LPIGRPRSDFGSSGDGRFSAFFVFLFSAVVVVGGAVVVGAVSTGSASTFAAT
jgi:hypothetical protein